MENLKKQHEIIDIFCNLVSIPSPSKHEENVVKWIKSFCEKENIPFKTDDYGNVIIKIAATDSNKPLIGFSSHMDVVGDDSPIVPTLDGEFIHANGRTLGADDKAGVACALKLAKDLIKSDKPHGGVEIVFTRDEESGMSGIENFDFNNLSTKYILVCDADKLGQFQISGASYTKLELHVKAFRGGHSGIDIADKTRPNAAKLLAEICSTIPQGVYFSDETGVITSINLGGITAGKLEVTNVLNTDGDATYSIRSASIAKENELIEKIKLIVADFNKKYADIAEATLKVIPHLPPFEKSGDDTLEKVFRKAAEKIGIPYEISSFHAGAETHIYCQHKNAHGETFIPFLAGLADIYNMHSAIEKVGYKSLIKGSELLEQLFFEFNA